MKEEDKEKKSQKEERNKDLLGKIHQIDSNTKDYDQTQNKKSKLLISQDKSNEISHPTVIFNYKGKLTYIQCTMTDNIKTICERFTFEIKENINNLCFKINDNIINEKLKIEEIVDNGNKNINIIVENKMIDSEKNNYIIAEIKVKEDDLNRDLRIINSSEAIKYIYNKEDYYKYDNEKEIRKKCRIEINNKIISFNYFIKFKEKGIFKIKYVFTDNITKTTCMFYGCNSLTNIDLSNFNTQNVTDMSYIFSECSCLTNIDLSNFNTQNVTDMSGMFSGCISLIKIVGKYIN